MQKEGPLARPHKTPYEPNYIRSLGRNQGKSSTSNLAFSYGTCIAHSADGNVEQLIGSLRPHLWPDIRGRCEMMTDRQTRIAQHRAEMPRKFREGYNLAMSGRSRKAALRILCAECCGFEIQEVHRCTSPGCVLLPYRPRSRVSQGAPQSLPNRTEPKKTATRTSKDGSS